MKILLVKVTIGLALYAALSLSTLAQEKREPNTLSVCDQEAALSILEQQIAATRTFDDQFQRIVVLIRAAELLWPHQQGKARAVFAESFELANRFYKENGDKPRNEGVGMAITTPDPRYTVIGAIAQRDPAWARKLTAEVLSDEQSEATDAKTGPANQERTAEKLLTLASGDLLASDQSSALSFARSSLRFPATFYLSMFLYKFSEVNRRAADQFYQEALSAYERAPLNRLLYLSSYPFGNDREVGEMPGYTIYKVPTGFVPNPNLQRSFVQLLLLRSQQRLQSPPETASRNALSEAEQICLALTRLEKQIQSTLPELAAPVAQAKDSVLALLPPDSQSTVSQLLSERNAPVTTFEEQVEAAEKNPNVDSRDRQLASAVVSASASADLDLVLRVIDKISDLALRPQLLNWLYFARTQSAIKDKQLAEAHQLAAKVDELDQRAFLYFQIAEESLKQSVDQTQAREMLEEVIASADKAPPTVVNARTQLGVAYLYTKIDLNRAIAVLGEAVKVINRIEQPDLSRQFVIRRIEGKAFGIYAAFVTPGFRPESAFLELGKADFEGTLYQASNFTDKSLRARTSLAIIEPCLQLPPKAKKKLKK